MSRFARDNRGMSIAEVLIALMVLAVALIPILAGFQTSLATVTDSDEVLAATNLARQKIELAKISAYDTVATTARAAFPSGEDPSGLYEYEQIVTTLPTSTSNPSYKQVEVRVYKGAATSPVVTLVTYIASGGV